MAVAMDVTDEASVAAGVAATVRAYGGLDILVSNAGVLRAAAVTTQPVADFDLVTRVNYRGYFLAVKHAAPVMARQHARQPRLVGRHHRDQLQVRTPGLQSATAPTRAPSSAASASPSPSPSSS